MDKTFKGAITAHPYPKPGYLSSNMESAALRFSTGWECKVWGMPQTTLDKLIERDLSRALPLPPIRRDWPIAESYSAISYEAAA